MFGVVLFVGWADVDRRCAYCEYSYMFKFSPKCTSDNQIEKILCIPPEENRQLLSYQNNELYLELMLKSILSADAKPGNFLDTLLSIIDCRLQIALISGDDSVVNALADFCHNRVYGKKPGKQSFTRIYKDYFPFARLRELIVSHIFNSTENTQYIEIDYAGSKIYNRHYLIPDTEYVWTYTIKYLADETIEVYHAFNKEIPIIIKHMEILWDNILTEKENKRILDFIAQFEWWFMTTNITARSGAGIGDALSLILQRKTNIQIRNEFIHLDWEVLSRSLSDYITWRKEEISKKGRN